MKLHGLAVGLFLVTQTSFATSPVARHDVYCQSSNDNYRIWLYLGTSPSAHFEHHVLERRGLFGGRVVRIVRDNVELRGSLAQGSFDVGDFYSFNGRGNWSWTVEYRGGKADIWADGKYMGAANCN